MGETEDWIDEGKRKLGIAVVSVRIDFMGDHIANHSIAQALLEIFGQVLL